MNQIKSMSDKLLKNEEKRRRVRKFEESSLYHYLIAREQSALVVSAEMQVEDVVPFNTLGTKV